jgi:dTDP-4-amino-4,6-dideoxygalactose transaminase
LLAIVLKGLQTDLATWPPLFASVTYKIFRAGALWGIASMNRQLDPEEGASRLAAMPIGYLGQMTSTQATIALKQLESIDADTLVRIANASQYNRALAPLEMLITPKWQASSSNIFTCYPFQFREREALLRYAMRHQRDFAAQHLRNCADLSEFRELYSDCPNARAAARELIVLPTYPRYPVIEIQRNIEVIRNFLASGSN